MTLCSVSHSELLDKVQNEQEKVLSSQGYTATAMPPPPLTPTLRQGGGEGQKIQDIIGKTFQGELVSQVRYSVPGMKNKRIPMIL